MKNDKHITAIADKILRQIPMDGAISITFMHPQYGAAVVNLKKLTWRNIRDVAAGYLAATAPPSTQVAKALAGKLGKHRGTRRDDMGFDPRDGSSGKPERQRVPPRRRK
jgi:hypothetical protein